MLQFYLLSSFLNSFCETVALKLLKFLSFGYIYDTFETQEKGTPLKKVTFRDAITKNVEKVRIDL